MNQSTIPSLILVRHGESEGNIVHEYNDDELTDELLHRRDLHWGLTERGRQQARKAGAWVLNEFGIPDTAYISEATRAQQTASNMNLGINNWIIDKRVNERSWGDLSTLHHIRAGNAGFEGDRLTGRPVGEGTESLLEVRDQRIKPFLRELGKTAVGKNVIVVTHGEAMVSFLSHMLNWTDEQWLDYYEGVSPDNSVVANGQVTMFRNVNTNKIGEPIASEYRIATPAGPDEKYDTGWLNAD